MLDGVHTYLIRTFIELSLDISVCSLIELIMRQTVTISEQISFFISVSLIVLLGLLTLTFYVLILNNNFKIMNPKMFERFHEKYGVLWDGLKVKQDHDPIFNIYFIIRRFLFAFTITYLLLYPSLFPPLTQCLLIQFMSLSLCGYIGHSQPFELRKINLIEFFNELSTLAVIVQIMNLMAFVTYD